MYIYKKINVFALGRQCIKIERAQVLVSDWIGFKPGYPTYKLGDALSLSFLQSSLEG